MVVHSAWLAETMWLYSFNVSTLKTRKFVTAQRRGSMALELASGPFLKLIRIPIHSHVAYKVRANKNKALHNERFLYIS